MLLELDVNATLLSPKLTRTSLRTFSNLMNALSAISKLEFASFDNNLNEFTAEDLKLQPKIPSNGPLYTRIFEMAMDKIVSVLMKMSSEKRYNSIAKHLSYGHSYRDLTTSRSIFALAISDRKIDQNLGFFQHKLSNFDKISTIR